MTPGLSLPPMEHAVEWAPSWDCTEHCHHERKANHGIGGESLRLFLRVSDVGVSLSLRTNLRNGHAFYRLGPQLLDDESARRGPEPHVEGNFVHVHLAMRTELELVRNDTQPGECDVLASGVCYAGEEQNYVSAETIWTHDDTFAARHVLTTPKYDELILVACFPVWKRMADHLLAVRDKALAAHANLPHQCPTCRGKGLVPSVSLSQFNPPLP